MAIPPPNKQLRTLLQQQVTSSSQNDNLSWLSPTPESKIRLVIQLMAKFLLFLAISHALWWPFISGQFCCCDCCGCSLDWSLGGLCGPCAAPFFPTAFPPFGFGLDLYGIGIYGRKRRDTGKTNQSNPWNMPEPKPVTEWLGLLNLKIAYALTSFQPRGTWPASWILRHHHQ